MRPFPKHLFKAKDPKFVTSDGEDMAEDELRGAHLGFTEEKGLRTTENGERVDDRERT